MELATLIILIVLGSALALVAGRLAGLMIAEIIQSLRYRRNHIPESLDHFRGVTKMIADQPNHIADAGKKVNGMEAGSQ